ncbi:MAG TPA: DUF72 domain-containing protein [Acidimicrobiales bacterium]|nr:DUF72 domain-containing protein [Acidimicrobiales bacterium]
MAEGRILVGTCSWTDQTLVKDTDWYPKRSMSAAERLGFYAERFPLAEADSTYYFPPSPQLTKGWAERTPAGFTMNIKAYALLTGHPAQPNSLWPDLRDAIKPDFAGKRNVYLSHLPPEAVDEVWARFLYALRPLADAGKLGTVLMQYPEWFTAKKDNRAELSAIRDRWEDVPVCVEFRSPTWLEAERDRDRTLGLLRDLGLALVVVDAPPASGLPTVEEVTVKDLAVVRFHGRNDDTWKGRTRTAAERFRYLYSKPELEAWAPKLRDLAQRADRVHALMNNCYQDYGVRNAADLAGLLDES